MAASLIIPVSAIMLRYTKSIHPLGRQNTRYVFPKGAYEAEKSDGSMWQFNEFAEYMNKIESDIQSKLDRLHRHAEKY